MVLIPRCIWRRPDAERSLTADFTDDADALFIRDIRDIRGLLSLRFAHQSSSKVAPR